MGKYNASTLTFDPFGTMVHRFYLLSEYNKLNSSNVFKLNTYTLSEFVMANVIEIIVDPLLIDDRDQVHLNLNLGGYSHRSRYAEFLLQWLSFIMKRISTSHMLLSIAYNMVHTI